MGYFSDPTASMALGNINREYSNHVNRAKRLRKLYERGIISDSELEKAQAQFTGLYRHVLDDVLAEKPDKSQDEQNV